MLDAVQISTAWQQTNSRIGTGTKNLDALLQILTETYSKSERHYHTLEHVLSCLVTLDTLPHPIPYRTEIEIALWFHDAIYDPQRSDNEQRSATLLRSLCVDSRFSDDFIDRAARLVQVTDHKTKTDEETEANMAEAEAIIADLDMAILAVPSDQYIIYTQQIRQEYACYDNSTFSQGRTQFLKALLTKPQIYRTKHFHKTLEAQARSNLRTELERLEGNKSKRSP